MKKLALILSLIVGGLLSVQAQGLIVADNQGNTGGPAATTSGLFYYDLGGGPLLLTSVQASTLNLQIFGGADAGSMSSLATFSGGTALFPSGTPGEYYDFMSGASLAVSGVALKGTATLQLYAWVGAYATYADAFAAGALNAVSPTFLNPTGGGGSPPSLPATLTGMPSMILVPEPSTLALAGLGAALLLFRRRK
jgi:hypothetical protein